MAPGRVIFGHVIPADEADIRVAIALGTVCSALNSSQELIHDIGLALLDQDELAIEVK